MMHMVENKKEITDVRFEITCSDCGCKSFSEENDGYFSCQDCGLVRENMVFDYGPDWRKFSNGEGTNNERHGPAKDIFQHDYGITTEITPTRRDGSGASLSNSSNSRWNRLRRLDNKGRIRNATERNLVTALSELKRIASSMSFPKPVAQDAAYIYRKAVGQKLIRGRSIEGVVAASLYAACRMHNNPRTLDDIGKHSRTGRKEIGRTYRFLRRQLGLTIGLASPHEYIPRFCDQLGVGLSVQSQSYRILEEVGSEAMVSRGPTGIAAASIYLAGMLQDNTRTQREVASVAGVTEVTIRNRFKELCEVLKLNPDNPKEKFED
jgi:transcription initiation factor TFIIB